VAGEAYRKDAWSGRVRLARHFAELVESFRAATAGMDQETAVAFLAETVGKPRREGMPDPTPLLASRKSEDPASRHVHLETLLGDEADQLLAVHGLAIDDASRRLLLEQAWAAKQDAVRQVLRNAEGDYRPTRWRSGSRLGPRRRLPLRTPGKGSRGSRSRCC
jgi:hypothetical protein